jgi:hypothetical protein
MTIVTVDLLNTWGEEYSNDSTSLYTYDEIAKVNYLMAIASDLGYKAKNDDHQGYLFSTIEFPSEEAYVVFKLTYL